MCTKGDQSQIREVLRDTIKLLCKNGLKYNAEFSIEGLLGITIDSQEIFLVNINETFSQPDANANVDIVPSQSAFRATSPRSTVTYSPYNKNSFDRRTMGYTYSGLKKIRQRTIQSGRNHPPKIWLTDVSGYSNGSGEASAANLGNECTNENDFTASYNTEDSRNDIEGESHAETSGEEALQRLADCVGRINKKSSSKLSQSSSEDTLLDQDPKEGLSVKEEILSDSENVTCSEVEIAVGESTENANVLVAERQSDLPSNWSSEDSPVGGRDLKSVKSEGNPSVSWFSSPEGAGPPVFPMFSSGTPSHAAIGGRFTSPFVSPQMSTFPANLKVLN